MKYTKHAVSMSTALKPLTPAQQLSLLQEDYTTVSVVFITPACLNDYLCLLPDERDAALRLGGTLAYPKSYTYKANKNLDLQVGELVLVATRGEIKMVQVVRVDATPAIDLHADYGYKWVIDRLDTAPYRKRQKEEKSLLTQLRQLDFTSQKQALLNHLKAEKITLDPVADDEIEAKSANTSLLHKLSKKIPFFGD